MRTSNQRSMAPVRKQEMDTVSVLKRMMGGEELKRRFSDILGKKAPQFMASIVNATAGNAQLQKCDPGSIASAALVAATLDLPIDPNLGFAAIVPYGDKAQFQVQWKGIHQLAMRTGQYRTTGRGVVYEDELVSYDPIYGTIVVKYDPETCTQRMKGEDDKIAGYLAWFELLNGFRKELFMTKAEVEHHALMYSKSYQYDVRNHKQNSRWSIDFTVMALKTVYKRLLSQYGILSTEMATAITEDQKVYDADGTGSYADNPNAGPSTPEVATPDAMDAEYTEVQPPQPQPQEKPESETKKKQAKKTAPEPEPDPFGGMDDFGDITDEDVANIFGPG